MKLYLIVAAWPVTKGNHAGMFYLANRIKESLECETRIYKLPVWNVGYLYPLYRIYTYLLALYLRFKVKKDDVVWLMEYLLRTTEQSGIACLLKNKVSVIGLAHLVPEIIEKQYTKESILKNILRLKKLYVFGSSLKNYFVYNGVPSEKITTTYHYVDTDYYVPDFSKRSEKIQVICMGNMQRDYDQLSTIIKECPNVHFIICGGRHNLKKYFDHYPHVQLLGYMSEYELKSLMQESHLSLNVMKDTIGSNVIVSSMACGLPVIASNVGSIQDYVEDNISGYLFKSPEQAAKIINDLSEDPVRLLELSHASRIKAEKISLKNFIKYFQIDNSIV